MTPKIWIIAGLFGFFALCALASCNDDNKQDQTDTVDRSGSIETAVSVQHSDSTHDIILTTHKIWVNFTEYKTVVHQDTVPALGLVTTQAENADGDTKTVKVPKDYQIFITMK